MELTQKQIKRFIEINKELPEFEEYSEAEVREIANGVANYYLTLFAIYRTLEKEGLETISNGNRG